MELRSGTMSSLQGQKAMWFFPLMAWLMLAVVLIGFAPTLYLRPLGNEQLPTALRTLPGHLYAHGVALSAWFLLFVTQTMLIANRRYQMHRTIGSLAIIVALAVILTTSVTLQHAISNPVRLPLKDNPVVFFTNAMSVLQFAVLVSCGVAFRARSDTHKRLMYLANVSLLTAAISRWPGVIDLPPAAVANISLVFLLALIVRDMLVEKRLHRATIWGGIVFSIVSRLVFISLGLSPLGRWSVDALA